MGQFEVCEPRCAMTRTTAQATMPSLENGTVLPRQVPQAARLPREYLTPKEVERLIAARQNRYGHRDPARAVRLRAVTTPRMTSCARTLLTLSPPTSSPVG